MSPDIDEVVRTALVAPWDAWVRRNPGAMAGDLSAECSAFLHRSARDAVADWVEHNVPPGTPGVS